MPDYLDYSREIIFDAGTQRHPFLCVSCGRLLNAEDNDDTVANYQCLALYRDQIRNFTIDAGKKPAECTSFLQEDLQNFLDEIIKVKKYAKQFAVPLTTTADPSGQQTAVTTIPALSLGKLVQMATLLEGSSNETAQKLRKFSPEDNTQVLGAITMYARSENSIIRNVYRDEKSYTIYRCCPYCGAQIDCRAGAFPERRIGVVGTPRQGKSAVLTATIHSFLRENYHIQLIENESDAQYQKFEKDYLKRYESNISIIKTKEMDKLAYRFTLDLHGEKRNLLFVDIAGELLQESGREVFLESYKFFMYNIDCFWMCTDDFQIRRLEQMPVELGLGSSSDVRGKQLRGGALDSMLKLLATDRSKPCAVLLVKSDALNPNELQAIYESLEKRDGLYCYETDGCLSEQEVYRLRNQLRNYIVANNAAMARSFESHFDNVGYLTCSAYGHPVAKFNTAFGKDMLLLYVPEDVSDDLFSDGAAFDVELHLGRQLNYSTQQDMLARRNYAPSCKVEIVRLRRGNELSTFSARAIRIPLHMDESCSDGILRLLTPDPMRAKTWKCSEGGNNNDYFIQFAAADSVSLSLLESNGEIPLRVVDRPRPDQVSLPLLWTLAVLGEYPTVGVAEVQQSFLQMFWQREPQLERHKYKGDEQSRMVLCGKKLNHTSN